MTIEEIKQSQIDNKISDTKLCLVSGVSITTWWRYKNGEIKNPSYNNVVSLINAIESIKTEIELNNKKN